MSSNHDFVVSLEKTLQYLRSDTFYSQPKIDQLKDVQHCICKISTETFGASNHPSHRPELMGEGLNCLELAVQYIRNEHPGPNAVVSFQPAGGSAYRLKDYLVDQVFRIYKAAINECLPDALSPLEGTPTPSLYLSSSAEQASTRSSIAQTSPSSTFQTPLKSLSFHNAAQSGDLDTVIACVNAGVSLNEASENDQNTALHLAAMHGHANIISVLGFAKGIEIDAVNTDQNTPLLLAVKGDWYKNPSNRLVILSLLLVQGASPTHKNQAGETPRSEFAQICQLLDLVNHQIFEEILRQTKKLFDCDDDSRVDFKTQKELVEDLIKWICTQKNDSGLNFNFSQTT